MRAVRNAAWLLGLASALGLACSARTPESRLEIGRSPPSNGQRREGQVLSNIARRDYAGSNACAPCHAQEYSAWLTSPMHRMTRALPQTEINAPFTGSDFRFRKDSVHLEQVGRERFMRLQSSRDGNALFHVTKVIGGRYREDFVGARVDPNSPLGPAWEAERILPLSYLAFSGEWRYKGYSVMVHEREDLEPGVVWKSACIFCHNTTPTLSLLLDDVYGAGAHAYQGSVSVELPVGKRPRYVVRDESAFEAALARELSYLGKPQATTESGLKHALSASIDATRDAFGEQSLVELGIGCEACHGGAREHVADPTRVRPTLSLRSDFLEVTTASGAAPTHAEDVNRTCAKCHTVLFSRYPYTWEGQTRRHDPGGSSINSGEARDFQLGACNSQLSCIHCHDPHREDPKSALQALEGAKGDELCSSCHEDLKSEAARRAHSHHAPDNAGSHCVNCHMAKKNMGLAYDLTRYHRIGSPTDRERVEGDRPLECALCHTDKSVEQLLTTMELFWGKRYDRQALRRLYGDDLSVNAIAATLALGKPHEQGTAVALAGRDQRRDWLPLVVAQLGNDYLLVRYFARHAVERITGAPLDVDLNLPGPEAVQNAQRSLATRPRPPPTP